MKTKGNKLMPRELEAAIRTASFGLLIFIVLLVGGCTTNRDIIRPRCVNSPILDYPPEAILNRESGELEVLIHLKEDGSVIEIKIVRSTGVPILDETGMEFVESLEFLPLVSKGRKQSCWVEQSVVFKLEKSPLDTGEWSRTTHSLFKELKQADEADQAGIQESLYSQCTDYMSFVIVQQDLSINRMAIRLVAPPLREKWGLYEDTFPMSFLMLADYVARFEDSPYRERALMQLKRSVQVDLLLIEEDLRSNEDPGLLHLQEQLQQYLAELP